MTSFVTLTDATALPGLEQAPIQTIESRRGNAAPTWIHPRKTVPREGGVRTVAAGSQSAAVATLVPGAAGKVSPMPVRSEILAAVIDSLGDPFFSLDRQGGLTYVNHAAEGLLGRPAQELLGTPVGNPLSNADTTLFALACGRALAGAETVEFEAQQPVSGKSLLVRVFPAPGGLAVWVKDISAARKREMSDHDAQSARLRQRAGDLEAANEELKAFAYSLAHDLRAPIATIDGFSALLDGCLDQQLPERHRHYLRRIRAASKQMGDYTEALLSLASVSQQTLHSVDNDLSAIAAAVLADLHERDVRRIAAVEIQPALRAQGDPRLLKMALENLLGNAWKFTSRRECAEIRFGAAPGPDGDDVFFVKDNGAGFDNAYADKLFGTFKRLHSQAEFPGTGVGLANVHRIITRHGGRIWAESVPGQGATFYFTLSGQPGDAPAGARG